MKVLHFADLHLGVESYGRIDPASGLSSRLIDFLASFDQVIDYTLENKIDLVLFCGDAYKSREPSQTQQREFARRIKRLSESGIPVFLLIGNHDLPNAVGRATATEIFDTLAVENVYVSNRPDIYHIPTNSGTIQIVSLPWLRRSVLLSKEETKNLNFEQVNQKLQQVLTNIIATMAAKLDPAIPAILAAHVWVTGAHVGSESMMTIGQEHVLLSGNIAHPSFDYIALGHLHRHQVVAENPPVVYAGSLGQQDFGDEGDEKGFYLVEIEPEGLNGKRQVAFEFHPVSGRRFVTANVSLDSDDTDPTATVLKAIVDQGSKVKDAIVRLNLSLPAEMEGQVRDSDIRNALQEAHYFAIAKDVQRETRFRMGQRTAEGLSPLDALKVYLDSKQEINPERAKLMLDYGSALIQERSTEQ